MALKPAQVEDLRKVFDALDSDGSGYLSAKEIHTVMSSFSKSATLADAEALISSADPNSDGTVDFREFKRAMALKFGESASAAQLFEKLDADGTGLLSPNELRAALEKYGCDSSAHSVDEMIRCVDTNGDGMVGMQEFADALRKGPLGGAPKASE